VKQLNQLEARFNRLLAGSRAPRPTKRTQRRGPNVQLAPPGITSVNVPMETAYTVKQITRKGPITERAREYIGSVTFLPSSPTGQYQQFMMSPALLTNTRLQRIGANYQKYRFRKFDLTLQSSTTTSTNGLYVVGYNSNPDAELNTSTSVAQIFDLPGAQSSNVWRTTTTCGQVEDPNKWYNLDTDSREIMQTIQGYFAVALQTPPSMTGPLTFPVILDYECQFIGSALNSIAQGGAVFIFPAGEFSYNSITGNYTFSVASGETVTEPTLVDNQPYFISPVYGIPTGPSGAPELVTPQIIVPTTLGWLWYLTLEDYQNQVAVNADQTFFAPRTTLEAATGN